MVIFSESEPRGRSSRTLSASLGICHHPSTIHMAGRWGRQSTLQVLLAKTSGESSVNWFAVCVANRRDHVSNSVAKARTADLVGRYTHSMERGAKTSATGTSRPYAAHFAQFLHGRFLCITLTVDALSLMSLMAALGQRLKPMSPVSRSEDCGRLLNRHRIGRQRHALRRSHRLCKWDGPSIDPGCSHSEAMAWKQPPAYLRFGPSADIRFTKHPPLLPSRDTPPASESVCRFFGGRFTRRRANHVSFMGLHMFSKEFFPCILSPGWLFSRPS
jgi:hypothetical protein